jgi:hypothetical protein
VTVLIAREDEENFDSPGHASHDTQYSEERATSNG